MGGLTVGPMLLLYAFISLTNCPDPFFMRGNQEILSLSLGLPLSPPIAEVQRLHQPSSRLEESERGQADSPGLHPDSEAEIGVDINARVSWDDELLGHASSLEMRGEGKDRLWLDGKVITPANLPTFHHLPASAPPTALAASLDPSTTNDEDSYYPMYLLDFQGEVCVQLLELVGIILINFSYFTDNILSVFLEMVGYFTLVGASGIFEFTITEAAPISTDEMAIQGGLVTPLVEVDIVPNGLAVTEIIGPLFRTQNMMIEKKRREEKNMMIEEKRREELPHT